MPHFCFMCPDGTLSAVNPQTSQRVVLPDQRRAGGIERICCCTPFARSVLRQFRHPQTGQIVQKQVAAPDEMATWNWLQSIVDATGRQAYPFVPGADYQCVITNPAQSGERTPVVYCCQITAPAVARAPVDAPTAQPVGNPGAAIGMPPLAGQKRTQDAGIMEPLSDVALPGNADPTLGTIDPEGGTFTDTDILTGQELPREYIRQAPPPMHQQVHGEP